MVHRGPRPAHRAGTVGRPWRRFRKALVDAATHCEKCGRVLDRDTPCNHPTHQGLRGCVTAPGYPTLEHPQRLVDGGAVRDRRNAMVLCFSCNSGGGVRRARPRGRVEVPPSRTW